jgi:hypothetical protein
MMSKPANQNDHDSCLVSSMPQFYPPAHEKAPRGGQGDGAGGGRAELPRPVARLSTGRIKTPQRPHHLRGACEQARSLAGGPAPRQLTATRVNGQTLVIGQLSWPGDDAR